MPGYKGHLVGGALTYGAALYLMVGALPPHGVMAEWLICTLAGALFPDIDVKSKGQKLFYWVVLAVLLLVLYKGRHEFFILISILATVPMLVKHRGLFHKLWFVIAFPLGVATALGFYFPAYSAALMIDVLFFIAGAVSHLWLDLGLKRMLRF